MEKLPERILQHGSGLTLSEKSRHIVKVIGEVNSLVGFAIPFEDLKAWASDIERLSPDTTPEDLMKLIDDFKLGYVIWDKSEGIQNIFRNLGGKKIKVDWD